MPMVAELLTLALQHHQAGDLARAADLYAQVLRQEPQCADALHLLGMVAHQVGRQQTALDLLHKAIALDGSNPVYLSNLGVVQRAVGDLAGAAESYRRALQLQPDSVEAHVNLGVVLAEQNQRAEAKDHYRAALRRKPDYPLAHNNLGNLFKEEGRWDEAEACYREALRLQPDFALALNNLGNTLKERKRLEEALDCFREALRLQPGFAEAHNNMGTILRQQGFPTEAEACYRQAIQCKPDFAEARNNLGLALMGQGKSAESLPYFEEAVALRDNYGAAWNNLGVGLMEQGRLDKAVDCFRRSLQAERDSAETYNNLGTSLMRQGCWEEALTCFQEALRLKPDFAFAHSNLLFARNYDLQVDPEALFAEHCRWGQLHGQPTDEEGEKGRRGEGEKGRKGNGEPGASATGEALGTPHSSGLRPPASSLQPVLRIGYVSPDFRGHAVARFFLPILTHHDPAGFETFCYSNVGAPDAMTARLQALAQHWRPISRLSDAEAAEQIRADGIDILVDLAGHTAYHRLKVFALKPAPVQVTYLGYPNTTGLTQIDYKLTDAVLDPPGENAGRSWHTEELVRLPGGVCCYQPAEDAPEVTPLPARASGGITFGSLHRLDKLNAQVFDLWTAVLRAVPGSRLLMFRDTLHGAAREKIRQAFQERGIEDARLDLRHDAGVGGYLAVYGEIDLSLDVFPWTAGTTACDSLWMGVPILTLQGRRHLERVTAALLNCAGLLEEMSAATPEEYVALAVRWANDRDRLAALRTSLRDRMRSTICDGARFTRELEEAYRAMWRRFVGA